MTKRITIKARPADGVPFHEVASFPATRRGAMKAYRRMCEHTAHVATIGPSSALRIVALCDGERIDDDFIALAMVGSKDVDGRVIRLSDTHLSFLA